MLTITKDWNPNQKKLAGLLLRAATFDEASDLCLMMHNQLHDLSNESGRLTIFQRLLGGLPEKLIRYRPKNQFSSIAWNIWHITRIEDAVVNVLIENDKQVLDEIWQKKLKITTNDTGNAFKENDVDNFDSQIDTGVLQKYRKTIERQTHKIISDLQEDDRKRKPSKEQLYRIESEGVVTNEEESKWLVDFWSRKNIEGLLKMPINRHQIVHINDCFLMVP